MTLPSCNCHTSKFPLITTHTHFNSHKLQLPQIATLTHHSYYTIQLPNIATSKYCNPHTLQHLHTATSTHCNTHTLQTSHQNFCYLMHNFICTCLTEYTEFGVEVFTLSFCWLRHCRWFLCRWLVFFMSFESLLNSTCGK